MDGSKLASGRARGASFQTGVQAGVEADLKLLSRPQFEKRYGLDVGSYDLIIEDYTRNGIVPSLTLWDDGTHPEPPMEYRPMPEQQAPTPRVSQYRGIPLGENILVQRVDKDHTSTLIIPDNALGKSDIGFVVAVGEGVKSVTKGQMILFDKFASHGMEIELVDEEGIERQQLILKEYDVLLKLEKIKASE